MTVQGSSREIAKQSKRFRAGIVRDVGFSYRDEHCVARADQLRFGLRPELAGAAQHVNALFTVVVQMGFATSRIFGRHRNLYVAQRQRDFRVTRWKYLTRDSSR